MALGCLVFAFAVIIAVKSCKSEPPSPPTQDEKALTLTIRAKSSVQALLKDPNSARFGELDIYDPPTKIRALVACGTVSAKNSFGGYGDPVRFVSIGTAEGTVLEEQTGAAKEDSLRAILCRGILVRKQPAE